MSLEICVHTIALSLRAAYASALRSDPAASSKDSVTEFDSAISQLLSIDLLYFELIETPRPLQEFCEHHV
jgi:hypothetical protein